MSENKPMGKSEPKQFISRQEFLKLGLTAFIASTAIAYGVDLQSSNTSESPAIEPTEGVVKPPTPTESINGTNVKEFRSGATKEEVIEMTTMRGVSLYDTFKDEVENSERFADQKIEFDAFSFTPAYENGEEYTHPFFSAVVRNESGEIVDVFMSVAVLTGGVVNLKDPFLKTRPLSRVVLEDGTVGLSIIKDLEIIDSLKREGIDFEDEDDYLLFESKLTPNQLRNLSPEGLRSLKLVYSPTGQEIPEKVFSEEVSEQLEALIGGFDKS